MQTSNSNEAPNLSGVVQTNTCSCLFNCVSWGKYGSCQLNYAAGFKKQNKKTAVCFWYENKMETTTEFCDGRYALFNIILNEKHFNESTEPEEIES